MPFNFNTVPAIISAPGAIRRLGEIAAPRLGKRVLLVTDPGLMATGIIEPALASLRAAGIEIALFHKVEADPPEACVLAAADTALGFGASGVLGLGGGSSLDVAKLAALLAKTPQALADTYGVNRARGARLPLILAPTTAGTGSEVTAVAVVTTSASEKMGTVSPILLPDAALLDAELTLGLPSHITAATGIDAMVHAIEAFTSIHPNNSNISQALAREALRLLGANIHKVVENGGDLAAREAMLTGSLLAGMAFANASVGAIHALAYPLGGHYHLPHGLTNALVMPEVMRFNVSACAASYAHLAHIVFDDLPDESSGKIADLFIDRLASLAIDIGIAKNLRALDIPETALAIFARDAMKQTRLLVNNPRPVHEADALGIYQRAW